MKIPSHLSKSWSHNQIIFSKMSGRSSVLLLLDFIEWKEDEKNTLDGKCEKQK